MKTRFQTYVEILIFVISQEQEVFDIKDAIMLDVQNKSVEFKNVCFAYSPEKQILKNVSFSVMPGETLALVHFAFIVL